MAAVGLRGVGGVEQVVPGSGVGFGGSVGATASGGLASPSAAGGNPARSWDSLVKGMESQIGKISSGGLPTVAGAVGGKAPVQGIPQLGELLKLQVEMHRVQVRVELLSKVTESATATFRKLEQGQ